jgi:uncharacterized membrane protein YdjX (TVP38/TMEM64 family)
MVFNRIFHPFFKLRFWLLVFLVAALAIALHGFNWQALLQPCLQQFNALVVQNPLMFILFFNIATLLCIPASLLALKAGYVFGLGWGTIYVLVAAILGAILAFWVGRYLAHHWVRQKVQENLRFQAIAQAVAKEGWKIVLLTRLSPLFPFNLTNYALGLTQISLKNYVLGSLGILPGTILYTYMGSLTSDLTMVNLSASPSHFSLGIAQWGMRLVGLAATLLITLYVSRVAKKALNQRVTTNLSHSLSPSESLPKTL